MPDGYGGNPFPGGRPPDGFFQGGGAPFGGFGEYPGQSIVPSGNPGTGLGAAAGGSTGSSFNIGQIKGMIDKLGGIEGIIGTVTKMQKVFSSIQQMAPMLRLLASSFGKAKATTKGVSTARRRTRSRRAGYSSGRTGGRPRRR
ncbi:MAG: aminotransferase [Paenibacillaceae bacterium]|nr:aminotransferase [Paenibacillaceae bacterium]